jgi:hypothetical protein
MDLTPEQKARRRGERQTLIADLKRRCVFAAALSLYTLSPHCVAVAQEVVPVIYLSTAEAATARQTTHDLKSAQDRDKRAATAWRDFHQSYQATHPELPDLQFAFDFRVAVARKPPSSQSPLEKEAAAVELTSQERQKAESLHREMVEAKQGLYQAQKSWSEYWHQLVFNHAPPSPATGGEIVTLANGKSATIPNPWANGIMFTPDFRIAVPR